MDYLLHIAVVICIYGMLATSLNLVVGYTGLLSVCHAGFYGIGAYVTAIVSMELGWPWWAGVAVGMGIAGLTAALIGVLSIRFRGDYLVIATIGCQVMIYSVLQNWIDLTRGPIGITGIPAPQLLAWKVSSPLDFALLAGVLAGTVYGLFRLVVSGSYGRVLRAIRGDEAFAASLGKSVSTYKVCVFAVGAAGAAVAGSLYASYIGYIDPSSFTIMESVLILTVVVVGGAGSRLGPFLGAAVLLSVPELLRFLGLPSSVAANLRQILYGGLLVLLMIWRPQGLIGKYGFEKSR